MKFCRSLVALSVLTASIAAAQSYGDLHDFEQGPWGGDGAYPAGNVTFDKAGNMYGTTALTTGGGDGTVWKLSPAGGYTIIHFFGGTVTNANGQSGPDGNEPYAGVTIDAAGNLYGTTTGGGPYDHNNSPAGIIWEITNEGTYVDLHDFGATGDGGSPGSGVTLDRDGNLYGVVDAGGESQDGFVWELTTAGVYKDLHDFGGTVTNADGKSGPDGQYPKGNVAFDSEGNLFGTTINGGPNVVDTYAAGMIFEITTAGAYKDLHDFGMGKDGVGPENLTIDSEGNLYGTTEQGGTNHTAFLYGAGMIWTRSHSGVYRDLHDFGGNVNLANGARSPDGTLPYAGVTVDGHGNLFGTTSAGGAYWIGTHQYGGVVWEITSAGAYKDLHDFGGTTINADGSSGPDGSYVWAGVSLDKAGNLYGTAYDGGASDFPGQGMIWLLSEAKLSDLTISPTTILGGGATTGVVKLSAGAPTGGATIALTSNSSSATVPTSVLVAAGATTATFKLTTSPVAAPADVTVTAKLGTTSSQAKFVIDPPALTILSLNHASVTGGSNATGTLVLSGPAPSAGFSVVLHSSSISATVPGSVTVPGGKKNVTFTVETLAVATQKTATISAGHGSVTEKSTLVIDPPTLVSVKLDPEKVTGGTPSTGTVTISGPAPSEGFTTGLSSTSKSATVPVSVKILPGTTSASFTVKTSTVKAQTTATISAKAGTIAKTATLTISP